MFKKQKAERDAWLQRFLRLPTASLAWWNITLHSNLAKESVKHKCSTSIKHIALQLGIPPGGCNKAAAAAVVAVWCGP
jgi:hypothetical protein